VRVGHGIAGDAQARVAAKRRGRIATVAVAATVLAGVGVGARPRTHGGGARGGPLGHRGGVPLGLRRLTRAGVVVCDALTLVEGHLAAAGAIAFVFIGSNVGAAVSAGGRDAGGGAVWARAVGVALEAGGVAIVEVAVIIVPAPAREPGCRADGEGQEIERMRADVAFHDVSSLRVKIAQ